MSTIWNGVSLIHRTSAASPLSCILPQVNSVSGAQCIYVMLHAIFPSIARIENKMGAGSALTSASMICFFIFVGLAGVMIMLDVSKVSSRALHRCSLLGWIYQVRTAADQFSSALLLRCSGGI